MHDRCLERHDPLIPEPEGSHSSSTARFVDYPEADDRATYELDGQPERTVKGSDGSFTSARTGTLSIKVHSSGKKVVIDGVAIRRN